MKQNKLAERERERVIDSSSLLGPRCKSPVDASNVKHMLMWTDRKRKERNVKVMVTEVVTDYWIMCCDVAKSLPFSRWVFVCVWQLTVLLVRLGFRLV